MSSQSRIHLVAAVLLLLITFEGRAESLTFPDRDHVLDTLRPSHPRLLASDEDFARLRSTCESHPEAAKWRKTLSEAAEALLDKPPLEYEIPDGKRLLSVSRAAKDRLLLLGLMYRLTDDARLAERAWQELDTITQFKDWNPSHFLDTAEMTMAVAIGYDWLFDAWTCEQREQLRRAIITLGLEPGLKVYRENGWWSRARHNWNQVCNGGMTAGALAIAEDEAEVAAEVISAAVRSVPLAMEQFQPDGGWGEGPGYWDYATEYNVFMLAMLQSSLCTDFGLGEMSGFPVTGDFPMHFVGPTGRTFNYADAHDGWRGANQLFWLATRFGRPRYAASQMPFAARRTSPLDLLWGAAWLEPGPMASDLPLDRHFDGVSVVTMRSAWNDPDALFVGFKGGDNRVNHGHLDLGSFILEHGGVRWAIDLGPDDYNIPGYFGKQRWDYYRNRTEGHNTLVINGLNQATTAAAKITHFESTEAITSATADLTEAYPDAARVRRTLTLLDRRELVIRDEIESDQPVSTTWYWHTKAEVELAHRRASLTQDGKTLVVELVEPALAQFAVSPATTESPQLPLENVNRLSIEMPRTTTTLQIEVRVRPE
ncbi:MAG: heparinase II/III-family protein [Planctomycetales bacterium]|nr:heparinase II/III-family protein [Planctomycetales bacterium]